MAAAATTATVPRRAAPETIQVVVRVRPWNEKEKKEGTVPVVHPNCEKNEVSVVRRSEKSPQQSKQTKYGGVKAVLTGFSSQQEVFTKTVAPLVTAVMHGYQSTAFAYGQTGTGKTYTMIGDPSAEENMGVIPRAARHIFSLLEDGARFEAHRVTVQFLEIYNEELSDLLLPAGTKDRPKLTVVVRSVPTTANHSG